MKLQSKLCAALLAASSLSVVGTAHAADGLMGSLKNFFAPEQTQSQPAPQAVKASQQAVEAKVEEVTQPVKEEVQNDASTLVETAHGPFSCKIGDLKITTKRVDGKKTDGLIVTMTNKSQKTCTMMGRPDMRFNSNSHVGFIPQAPRGFMPGPVIIPRTLRPHDVATMQVKWSTANRKDGQCVRIHGLTMSTHALNWHEKMRSSICGGKGAYVTFSQSSLQVKNAPELP